MENLQLSLPGYWISTAVMPLRAEPSTGTTQWPVKEAELAELPGTKLWLKPCGAFPSSPTLEGAAGEQGSVLQVLPEAAGTASPCCQLGGGCFLLLPPVGNSGPQQHHHGGQTPV